MNQPLNDTPGRPKTDQSGDIQPIQYHSKLAHSQANYSALFGVSLWDPDGGPVVLNGYSAGARPAARACGKSTPARSGPPVGSPSTSGKPPHRCAGPAPGTARQQ